MLSVTIGGGETPAEKPAEAVAAKPETQAPAALNPQNPPVTKKDERPSWLPEQFKDAEQLAASYAELRAMLSRGEKLPPEEKPVEKPAAETKPEDKPQANPDLAKTDEEIRAEAASKNLNFDDFTKEFAEKGALTPESYETLAKAGYDKARVDAWIEGRVAVAEKRSTELFDIVGGKDEFSKVSTWAQANMPKAEIEAFNRATASGDQDLAKLAVTGLFAKFTAANGKEPSLLSGKPTGSSDVYRSRQELTADIKNPKYRSDPAFRKDVEDKAIRSNI